MSMVSIDYSSNTDVIKISQLQEWCEEISSVLSHFEFFKENKILCGVNSPWSWREKIDVKTKGLNFFSQWKLLAPRTNFMYLSNKPYVDSKQNAYRLFFINLDPYVFKLNSFLNTQQNFFFFFFHEFAHCLDLAYNQKIINEQHQRLIEHKSVKPQAHILFKQSEEAKTQKPTEFFSQSSNMEAFADIMAVKILYQLFPHLQIKHHKIMAFREYEAQRIKNIHNAHNTSSYFKAAHIQEFLQAPWEIDPQSAQELKTLI